MKRPKLRFVGASLFALLLSSAALFHVATISTAQHATPTVNGSIGLTEYGTLNSQSNGGTTWYMTWDETNLYVGTTGANTTEGAVLYIDADPPLPAGAGTNADGNATGQTYDSTNFSSLPFRADFVTYYKDSYREYRTADGAGGWSAATTGFGAYASDGSTVRELSIPWSAVTGAGRPDSFSFFAYATSPGGFVYGEVPPENPDGFIGTSANATRFYYVASTADGASTKPFTLNFTQSATYVVNTTADTNDADTADGLCLDSSALCSLRAAIQQANANPSADTVNFLIAGVGAQTINVGSASLGALPIIIYPLTIDGYTQPGSSQNTLAVGDNAVINIELNGTSAGAGADGLNISAGGSTVRGLSIYRFTGDGIDLNTAGGNTVAGNFIGTNATGTGTANGNAGDGVNVANVASNTIGGSTPAARNVISANAGEGIDITGTGATGNTVAGNYVGTDRGGTADAGNAGNGVFLSAPSNTVGGSTAAPGQGAGNVISGNTLAGVRVTTNGNNNVVAGNLVGLQSNGTTALRNDLEGVFITNAASSNTIGGATSNARNVISGHNATTNSDGVEINGAGTNSNVVAGNYIGTNAAGTVAVPNSDGVEIAAGAQSNTVGGSTATPGAAPGNVISGNTSDGVELTGASTSNNAVAGNLVGLAAGGATALGNSTTGVNVTGNASSNTIGGAASTSRNVISSNSDGVVVNGASSNTVAGNYIGTDITGAIDRGNLINGVFVAAGAQSNSIGGLTSTPGTAPGNVISGNASDGVEITGTTSTSNTVRGNLVGLAAGGTALMRNDSNGVFISNAASNTVGGTTATARNVITGGTASTSDGVDIQSEGSDNNVVAGNYVGTDINGTGTNGGASDFGSGGDGVRISGGPDSNTVGGSSAGAGNVIGGNGSDGVEIAGTGSSNNTVQGNFIGTQADGATALGNTAHGVHVSAANTPADIVGGTTAGTGNTIAFNGGDGVFIPTGFATVRRNSIHTNAGLGIDLGADGVTPNDAGDGDTGGNNLQNFPFITTAVQGSTVVTGTLNSTPSTTFTLEFFSSPAADPTGNGEGQTFLDSTTVTTDALGNAAFSYTVAATVAAGQYVSATATDPTGRTSEFSGARNVIIATLARLVEFTAVEQDGVVRLDWTTGYEVDNLGFNLYREAGGRRARLNPSLIAGSALVAGPGVALTAGNAYAWADASAEPGAAYWLEEIDLAGRSKTYGPFHPSRSAGLVLRNAARGARSPLISQLSDGGDDGGDAQRQVTSSDASRAKRLTRASGFEGTEAAREKQRWLASQAALKISVRAGGWYRVTRDELIAAGLNPAADPARLQLYAGGVEMPMRVDTATWLLPEGGVEFYGEGLDVPSTDTRVYWLVEGSTRGLRMGSRRASSSNRKDASDPVAAEAVTVVPVGPASLPYFKYTAERRERVVYFSSLQNGEAENFFGRVVNTGTAAQTLSARNVYPMDAQTATLEVSVQGVSLGQHHVAVTLNGVTLGALDFAGQAKSAAVFPVDSQLLREGDNHVQLVSGAPGDVSLTEYLRLNYLHAMRADGDALRFGAPSGVVSVGGFTTPDVRVFDVTDPYAPEELPTAGAVTPDPRGGWGVRVGVAGAGTRELLALTGARVSRPASVARNEPSRWSVDAGQRADMVVITHEDFAEQVAPLAAARAAEGMEVRVVGVEDIFDEFAYGAHTPRAVRDFLAWTRANWAKAPDYVLLVGDGSYDPRDYLGRGRFDLVPSKLLDAGAMETASDDWFADFDDDGVADLALGRLPVRTRAEAAVVVGKILSRTVEGSEPTALLVADRDGADGYSFESATNALQSLLPEDVEVARINRRGQDAGVLRSQIVAGVNTGPLVVNWMGHGSIDVWTGEGILRGADAPALTNGSRLPLFVMMTCLNGYYEGTGLDSLAESVLKAEGGGAYAVWASTGMTEPGAQAAANRELYRIIFSEDGVRLGDAVRRAKHATADRDVRRTWVFFGDPSSRLR